MALWDVIYFTISSRCYWDAILRTHFCLLEVVSVWLNLSKIKFKNSVTFFVTKKAEKWLTGINLTYSFFFFFSKILTVCSNQWTDHWKSILIESKWLFFFFYWKQALLLKVSQILPQATCIFVCSAKLLFMSDIIRWHKNVTNVLVTLCLKLDLFFTLDFPR